MKGFKNVNVYVDSQKIVKTSIGIENGKIAFIGDNDCEEIYSFEDNAIILPGFIDQHIHGSATADAMDGTIKALEIMSNSIASEGTTAFLATTMTQSPENISKAMSAVKAYKELNPATGAKLLGIHLEGPYINKGKAGAQPANYIIAPDIMQFDNYNELSGNSIKIVTLAPENENANEFISYLKSKNINASIGHTCAKYTDVEKAVLYGAAQITHTYNAQSAFGHREVGVIGSALLFDELACEVICDLIHVSVPALKLLFKNKPTDKVILISDAMRAKNLGDTISELGGQTVYVKNGEARLEDGTLAGSILRINDAIKNIVTSCGVPFTTAVDYATKNPAKNLGIYDQMGSISVGKCANFAILDKNTFEVLMTVRDGNVIYKNEIL